KMLGILPPDVQRTRQKTAWVVITLVVVIFWMTFRRVLRAFRAPSASMTSSWALGKYRFAYLLMAPALLTIALWAYWPLARGTVIAFQDYSVVGGSTWVGSGNFASVLYDPEFWHSIRASILYALLFILFGFWTPIALALLLSEIPRGGTFL